MKRGTNLLIALGLAAAIGTGGGVYTAYADQAGAAGAAPAVSGKADSCKEHHGKWGKKLGLTDEQKTKMKAVREKYRASMKPLVEQLEQERQTMRGLMTADTIDDAAIRAEVAKKAAVQADLAVQRAHMMGEMRGILTPEQIKKMKDARAEGKKGSCHKGKGRWMDKDEIM